MSLMNRVGKLFLFMLLAFTLVWTATPLLAEKKDTGHLKTIVDPRRAGVFVDGQYLGPTADFKVAHKFELSAGEHEVKLIDPRYEEFSTTVKIEAGKTTKLREKLKPVALPQPPFGRLRTVGGTGNNKYAAVFIDGKFMGHVDEFNNFAQGLLLKPGDYTVRIAPTGGGTAHEEKVKIEADKVTTVTWER
jgi:hypothetical protein